jgi:glycerol kinase
MELGISYGDGADERCFLLFNTGNEAVISDNGLLTTVGFAFPGEKPVYALEGTYLLTWGNLGSIAVAGSAVKWARDQLGIIKSASEIGELASQVKGTYPMVIRLMRYCRGSLYHCIFRLVGAVLAQ